MRYLGVDYGTKKVGLALSDEAGTMGFPHAIVPNTPQLVEAVAEIVTREKAGLIVIGESRDLAGGENPVAAEARAFGDRLALRASVPVRYESEVFTSAEARRGAPKGARVDASAAALILTSYLSRQNHE